MTKQEVANILDSLAPSEPQPRGEFFGGCQRCDHYTWCDTHRASPIPLPCEILERESEKPVPDMRRFWFVCHECKYRFQAGATKQFCPLCLGRVVRDKKREGKDEGQISGHGH